MVGRKNTITPNCWDALLDVCCLGCSVMFASGFCDEVSRGIFVERDRRAPLAVEISPLRGHAGCCNQTG